MSRTELSCSCSSPHLRVGQASGIFAGTRKRHCIRCARHAIKREATSLLSLRSRHDERCTSRTAAKGSEDAAEALFES